MVANAVASPWASRINRFAKPASLTTSAYDALGQTFPMRVWGPTDGKRRPALILCPGASPKGEEHEVMNRLAEGLGRAGIRAVIPRLPFLREVLIREDSAEGIVQSFLAVRSRADVRPDSVGLVGMSFSGALVLKACADPRIKGKPSAVVCYGTYYDFESLVRFVLTGWFRENGVEKQIVPNEYPRLAFFHNYLEEIGGVDNLAAARDFFWSRVADESAGAVAAQNRMTGKDLEMVESLAKGMTAEAAEAGNRILSRIRARVEAISPRYFVDGIDFPVFLLHGAADTMVPYTETAQLSRSLRSRGVKVTTLISRLYAHSNVDGSGEHVLERAWEILRLVRFVGRMIGALERGILSTSAPTKNLDFLDERP